MSGAVSTRFSSTRSVNRADSTASVAATACTNCGLYWIERTDSSSGMIAANV